MIWNDIQQIRAQAPLVMNITNFVAMNTTANALLALGAAPVMSNAVEEVEEMLGLANALVINIGTLSQPWLEAMLLAGNAARRQGIPIVLDPAGSGATGYRTESAKLLIRELQPAVIRGNASEIRSLVSAQLATKGVDSLLAPQAVINEAQQLSSTTGCVVSISGALDLIVDAARVFRLENGHSMMSRVTGMGCTASVITGAFLAINTAPLAAATHAMALMGVAGELAARNASGPGSFQVEFLDALHNISAEDLRQRIKLSSLGCE